MALGGLTTTVLPDANVLFSRTLRDWLAMGSLYGPDGWYEVRWTEDILVEVLYKLRKKNPGASDNQIGGVRDKMTESFAGGRISGYSIETGIDYPDIYDAHVHSAAVHGEVDFVITMDKGFDKLDDIADGLPYEVHTPDSFFCLLDDSSPKTIQNITCLQLKYWLRRSGGAPFNLCTSLQRAGAPAFADRVREYLQHC
jgi:hypothetical protein